MSVAIFRHGDKQIGASNLSFYENISGEDFYQRVWTKAIADTGVTLFREYSQFEVSDLEQVMDELNRLLVWAEANLSNLGGGDLDYMRPRIENLLVRIPEACKENDATFHIC